MADNDTGEEKATASGKKPSRKPAAKKTKPGTRKSPTPRKKPAKKTTPARPLEKEEPSTSATPETDTKSANDNVSSASSASSESATESASSSAKITEGLQNVKGSLEEGVEKIKGKINSPNFNTDKIKEAYQKNIGDKLETIASSEKFSEEYEKAKAEARHISWLSDIKSAFRFFTRLPLPANETEGSISGRALWAAPLVGVFVGLVGGLVFMLSAFLGLPDVLSASLAVAATILLTGCFHEDALADVADGFGGGWTREEKLEIMKDSRIGTYGATALFLTLIIKIGAIATMSLQATSSLGILFLLVASGAASRAAGVALLGLLPPASESGTAREAGTPPLFSLILALTIGGIVSLICLLIGFGFSAMLAGFAGAVIGGGFVGWLSNRQIGGSTGDVAGTTQQLAELGMFIAALVALNV